jgi:hypothetical protein
MLLRLLLLPMLLSVYKLLLLLVQRPVTLLLSLASWLLARLCL